MIHAVQRHAVMVIGIVLAGFVLLLAAPYLTSTRGDAGPTVLSAGSPIAAIVAILVCLAVATVVSGAVGRFVNAAVGLFVLGAGMFVLDGRMDTIRSLAFSNAGTNARWPLAILAIEGLMWAGLTLGAAWCVFVIAGPLKDIQPEEFKKSPHPLFSGAAMKGAAAGVVMLAAVWVIARSPMKGQMIGATFLGGVFSGLIGRLISPHVQPMLFFAAPILFGAIGYVIAMFMMNVPLDTAYVGGTLSPFALPMPLDYAAGSLMGVAFGLGWARSFLHHEEEPKSAVSPA